MIFREFDWPHLKTHIFAKLPDPNVPFFDPLLDDIIEQGVNLDETEAWGHVVMPFLMDDDYFDFLIIGERAKKNEPDDRITFSTTLEGVDVSIAAWHVIIRVSDNPIQIHIKWLPTSGQHMAFLNIQAVDTRKQLKAISVLVDAFDFVKAGGGRPLGKYAIQGG